MATPDDAREWPTVVEFVGHFRDGERVKPPPSDDGSLPALIVCDTPITKTRIGYAATRFALDPARRQRVVYYVLTDELPEEAHA